jgi:hypothetical protein
MPFDQLLQAGLMKQQALDRTNAAISEFQEQKMLTGGARTNTAAQQLNQEYGGKASALTDRIMTGEITPDQAAYERNINKAYNTDPAVKQVLMDQSLMNVSNQAIMNEKLRGGRAENPYYDYDSQTFTQAKLDELRSGKDVIGADNYALLTDPGLFEDFAPIINQLHEEYFTSQGITPGTYAYDGTTGTYKLKETGKTIGIDPDRLEQLIKNYVTSAPIEDSDRMSVQYRIARGNRMGTPYTEQNLIDDLMQANIFRPWMSYQEGEDLSGLGGGKGSGSKKDEEAPLPTVQVELDTFRSEQMDIRNKIYGINEDDPVPGIKKVLTDKGKAEAVDKKLAIKGYRIKRDASGKIDWDNPEFVYAGGPADGNIIEFGQDKDAALREYQEFKNDLKFYEGIEAMTRDKFEKAVGKSMDQFVNDILDKHGDRIDEKLAEYVTSPPNEASRQLTEQMLSRSKVATGNLEAQETLESELGKTYGMDKVLIDYNTMTVNAADVFSDFPVDGSFAERQAFLRSKYTDLGLDDAEAQKFADQRYYPGAGADKMLNPNKVPLAVLAKAQTPEGNQVRSALRLTFSQDATMDVLKEVDPVSYREYNNINEIATNLILENNRYKVGRMMNTQEGKDGDPNDRLLEYTVLRNTSLALKATEGDPGSGEKAGATLGNLYSKTNTAIEDYQLLSMYFSEGPTGDVQIYGRVMYSPKRSVDASEVEEVKEGIAEVTGMSVESGEAGRQMEFDINITDNALGHFVGQDLELIYQAASMMKDHVYTMERGDTRNIYIPGKYGPATDVTINKVASGIVLEGNVYGPDETGDGVMAVPVMEFWQAKMKERGRDVPGSMKDGKWNGTAMSEEDAAEFAALVAESTAGVKRKHKYLFDENGKYVGESVPTRIDERVTQVNETLSENADKMISNFNSVYKNTAQETVDELLQIMQFETAGTLKPDKRNNNEGKETAIGLIQFQQDRGKDKIKTIDKKEFTFEELARMSIPNQITKAVVPYLKEVGGNVKSIDDLYFAVFMPVFAGMNKDLTLQEAYEAGVAKIGEKGMKGLDPASLKRSNKYFKEAKTLNDIVTSVRTWGKF